MVLLCSSFKTKCGGGFILSPFLSLINSNEPTLVVAHVYYAHLNLSFQSDSPIYRSKNQSSYIVEDAKTSTLPNLHDTDQSMVLTSEQPSLTSSSSSTQP